MHHRKLLALPLLTPLMMAGCSNMAVEDYQNNEPVLNLFEYFEGDSRAWGIFEDRFGALRRQFTVDIKGEIDGNVLTLTEDFVYADGEESQRIWVITETAPNTYTGRADDIVGTATGKASGNALNWQYEMDLPVGDSHWRVHFDDWMYLQPNDVLINRARVTKWGVDIGEVSLFFQPLDRDQD